GSLVYSNGLVMLMPYFDQANLANLYNPQLPWFLHSSDIARTVIPLFVCPSNSKPNPFIVAGFAALGLPAGDTFGACDYVFCKGATDTLCMLGLPGAERGMFDANRPTRLADITDGSSNTLTLGEGAGGSRWPLCRGTGGTFPFTGPNGHIPA